MFVIIVELVFAWNTAIGMLNWDRLSYAQAVLGSSKSNRFLKQHERPADNKRNFQIDCGAVDCATGVTRDILLTINNDTVRPETNETAIIEIIATNGFATTGVQDRYTATILNGVQPTSTPAPVDAAAPKISLFDPAISKIGFLVPGQVGVTGEQIEWVVTVTNNGSATGNNITITDTIDNRLGINSVDAPDATVSISGQTVDVTYGTINPGQTVSYSIFTTVLDGVEVSNTACVGGTDICATGTTVAQLPNTGETPWWRGWLIVVAGLLLGIGLLLRRYASSSRMTPT